MDSKFVRVESNQEDSSGCYDNPSFFVTSLAIASLSGLHIGQIWHIARGDETVLVVQREEHDSFSFLANGMLRKKTGVPIIGASILLVELLSILRRSTDEVEENE